jgi:hypothetical protein
MNTYSKISYYILFILPLCIFSNSIVVYSQTISTAWNYAGYQGAIPDVTQNLINVLDSGVVADGVTDNAVKIQNIINNAPNPSVLFFPAGTYRFNARLSLRAGIVLRGDGYKQTILEFLSSSGCMNISGSEGGNYVNIQSGSAKGSNQIVVASVSGFAVGKGAEIMQDDIVPASAAWGIGSVGQMAKITAINGNTLTINPPLHIEYTADKNPKIRPINFIEQVGIEDLHIIRIMGDGNGGNNIDFRRACNCWVRRIESDSTEKYHISLTENLFLEIRDSYIHDAADKGDGGEGYGVSMGNHVTSVLVENNIFNELRHSMIIQMGTNGCVFGYNYSQRGYSNAEGEGIWDKPYISLHGHYPFENLFESNIVGWAYLGDYWGDIGPGNTLFRNRVIGTNKKQEFGTYRGIFLRYFHGEQKIIGNEVQGSDGVYFATDHTGNPDSVIIHGNNVLGTVSWDPAFPQSFPASYYLDEKPNFYCEMEWPSLGGDKTIGEGTIPALERWQAGNYVPDNPVEVNSSHVLPAEFSLSQNYPNPFNPSTTITYTVPSVGTSLMKSLQLKIYDILGREIIMLVDGVQSPGIHTIEWDAKNAQGQRVGSGVYFYRLAAGKNLLVKKLVLMK